MKTKAAYLNKLKEPLLIEDEIEIPDLKEGQVLVKVAYSGICHSQLMEAEGLRGEDKYIPHMLGHEGSGTVVSIGSKVSKVKEGDQVVLTWIRGLGLENGGTQYKKNNKLINAGFVTTFSEYTVVSENRVVKAPQGIDLKIATLFGCAVPTGAGIVLNQIQPPAQDSTIVIWGLGGIGLSALMGTQVHSFSKIIAVDIEDKKLDLAKQIGASHFINAAKTDAVSEIFKITENKGVDFAVESAGLTQTIQNAHKVVKKNGGQCIFASHPKHGDHICLDPFDLICGKEIKGSWGGGTQPDRDIPKFAKHYTEGKLKLDLLLKDEYEFNDINTALSDLKNRKVNRAIIKVN